jgi:tryptophan synthase alpha chain
MPNGDIAPHGDTKTPKPLNVYGNQPSELTAPPETTGRYERMFAQHRQAGKKVFIPFTVLGWPNRINSLAIIEQMIESGASALELGLAFSDPMADGPIIQKAAKEVINAGFTVNDAFELLETVRQQHDRIPIGLLVYYNMVLAQGVETFFSRLSAVGVDGILIADLPIDMMEEVVRSARQYNIRLIYIVSSLTTEDRLKQIGQYAGGFLYVVSRLGITGVEESCTESLSPLIQKLRAGSTLPLCVGFGVSSPANARQMLDAGADGVITGSRIIQIVETANTFEQGKAALTCFLDTMKTETVK